MKNSEDPHVRLRERLQERRSEHRYRTLETIQNMHSSRTVRMGNEEYLNFSSNDYLNLSNHTLPKEKSRDFTDQYGTRFFSSRLITGTLNIHRELEERITSLYQKEDALLFSTGFQANSTIRQKTDWEKPLSTLRE